MSRDRRTTPARTWWLLDILSATLVVAAVVGSFDTGATGKNLSTNPTTTSTAAPIRPAHRTVTIGALAHSLPVKLVIPAIGVSTRVGTLGLQPDGQIMVPTSVHYVGWFRFGPTPGQLGSSTILGHVDSLHGPGVFFNLKNLRAGHTLSVTLASRAVTHFVVLRVVEYSKSAFPDRLVYGPHGTRDLNLITCGGVFDRSTGHYESNIVVFARLTSVSGQQRV